MSALEEYTEAVAAAQRDLYVSEALHKEHRQKLKMAEEEVNASRRRLENAQVALSNAAVKLHEAVHGKPVSVDDRFEFERRWDARYAEEQERLKRLKELYESAEVKSEAYYPPGHPDHEHEDCCK